MNVSNVNQRLVGSNIEYLSKLDYVTGIQRVVIESHKYLHRELKTRGISLRGFVASDAVKSEDYKKSAYYRSDPVTNGDTVKLESLDIALLLDLDWGFSFPNLFMEKQRRNLPVISCIYDLLPITHQGWFPLENAKKSFRVYLQKLTAVSDHLVFNSESVYEDFKSLNWNFGGKAHVIPLGAFETPHKNPHYLKPPKSIISVATIEPRKGLDELLDAFDILRSYEENYNLFIVGRYGWHSEELMERITKHKDYGGRLRWFPKLTDAEVSALYDGCTISVAASFGEGFGLNVEEALAHNIKVVLRDIPVFREREQPNLFYFQDGAENLAKAIMVAEQSDWNPITSKSLRTMDDFGLDLLNLILSEV